MTSPMHINVYVLCDYSSTETTYEISYGVQLKRVHDVTRACDEFEELPDLILELMREYGYTKVRICEPAWYIEISDSVVTGRSLLSERERIALARELQMRLDPRTAHLAAQ